MHARLRPRAYTHAVPITQHPLSKLVTRLPMLQAVPMARALLELLPGMGSNAIIAHRVLRLMAGTGGWVGE